MKAAQILLLVWLACAVTGQAQSPTPLQMAATLEQGLRGKDHKTKNQWLSPEWESRFTKLRAAAQGLDPAAATVIIQQVEVADLPDAMRSLCHELLDGIRKERSTRNATLAHRVDAAIMKASETCRSAKDESELDPMQRELAVLRDELKLEPNEPKIEGLKTRLQWTAEAVSTWQDALALRVKGFEKEATERSQRVTSFVKGDENFNGPRNMHSTLNPDGSGVATWENLPGTEGDITLREMDSDGHWVIIGVAPAGSTSYHFSRDYEPPKPQPRPHAPSPSPSGSVAPRASGAASGHSPGDSGR